MTPLVVSFTGFVGEHMSWWSVLLYLKLSTPCALKFWLILSSLMYSRPTSPFLLVSFTISVSHSLPCGTLFLWRSRTLLYSPIPVSHCLRVRLTCPTSSTLSLSSLINTLALWCWVLTTPSLCLRGWFVVKLRYWSVWLLFGKWQFFLLSASNLWLQDSQWQFHHH